MWGCDGSGGVADDVQKMSVMFRGMTSLDTKSVNVNGMFDNKRIDNDLALCELSESDDDE